MSAPFVTTLRTGGRTIDVEAANGEQVTIRVQLHDAWDAIAVVTNLDEPVRAIKVNALQALDVTATSHEDYFIKLNGNLIFDEAKSLRQVGATDGSIFFIHLRRRRAVR